MSHICVGQIRDPGVSAFGAQLSRSCGGDKLLSTYCVNMMGLHDSWHGDGNDLDVALFFMTDGGLYRGRLSESVMSRLASAQLFVYTAWIFVQSEHRVQQP